MSILGVMRRVRRAVSIKAAERRRERHLVWLYRSLSAAAQQGCLEAMESIAAEESQAEGGSLDMALLSREPGRRVEGPTVAERQASLADMQSGFNMRPAPTTPGTSGASSSAIS